MTEGQPTWAKSVEGIAAWASIITLVMPALAVWVPGWDASLPYLSVAALIACVTLPGLLTAAWRRVNKIQEKVLRPATILILATPGSIGADKAKEVVMVAHDKLHYGYLEV